MDPRFLQLYNQELVHVRDSAAEFAQRFPKIASRLALDSTEVQDPYVERLLQGFAFLTARVQLRLEEEFPRFTTQLLNRLNPNALAPVPAMGVVQLQPTIEDPALLQGLAVKAGTVLQSQLSKGMQTPCKFTVAHHTVLSPCIVSRVDHGYFNATGLKGRAAKVRSALQITLHAPPGVCLSKLPLALLQLHIAGGDEVANPLFDRVAFQHMHVLCRPVGDTMWRELPNGAVQIAGLSDDEALLPPVPQALGSMRLLQEWFAMPARARFLNVHGLDLALKGATGPALELAFCFADVQPVLDQQVGVGNVLLNCTPVINLFPHLCDRIVLGPSQSFWPVQPNRTRPHDFEVHSILSVQGHAQHGVQSIEPLFAPIGWGHTDDAIPNGRAPLCYSTQRSPTRMSTRQVQEGTRSGYLGSELEISLSQPGGTLVNGHGLTQLEVRARCTNRDLPLLMPVGLGDTDLLCPSGLPVHSVRFVHGPTRPRLPLGVQQLGQGSAGVSAGGHVNWQLIQHLAGNFLGLLAGSAEPGPGDAVPGLQHWLSLHADPANPAHQALIEAVHAVQVRSVTLPLVRRGRPGLVRGLHLQLTLDELSLQGVGMGALGWVLANCFARHVSLNSFVQTSVRALQSGQVLEFAPRCGHRPVM
ncbi:MAG TPA: type VI secretion system baseplate subunit TssF [Limnobacter sp.]|nr:type VI secretion system baseplate subunit TssF [Limnobacter sp.]